MCEISDWIGRIRVLYRYIQVFGKCEYLIRCGDWHLSDLLIVYKNAKICKNILNCQCGAYLGLNEFKRLKSIGVSFCFFYTFEFLYSSQFILHFSLDYSASKSNVLKKLI